MMDESLLVEEDAKTQWLHEAVLLVRELAGACHMYGLTKKLEDHEVARVAEAKLIGHLTRMTAA